MNFFKKGNTSFHNCINIILSLNKRYNCIIHRIKNVMHDTQELPLKQFINWCHHFQNSYNGSDNWFESSAINIDTYKTCPGYPAISWKSKGFTTVIDLLQVWKFYCSF